MFRSRLRHPSLSELHHLFLGGQAAPAWHWPAPVSWALAGWSHSPHSVTKHHDDCPNTRIITRLSKHRHTLVMTRPRRYWCYTCYTCPASQHRKLFVLSYQHHVMFILSNVLCDAMKYKKVWHETENKCFNPVMRWPLTWQQPITEPCHNSVNTTLIFSRDSERSVCAQNMRWGQRWWWSSALTCTN